MTEENAPLTVTLKGGKDFADPWIVVRGDNPAQVVNMLRDLGELQQAVVEASNFFHATNNAATVLANAPGNKYPEYDRQAAPAPAPQQQAPQGWGQSAPAPQAAPQQQSAPQGVTLHPEGKVCGVCNQPLQFGKTRTNKGQWKCPAYRWNNGNPNEHTLEWAN